MRRPRPRRPHEKGTPLRSHALRRRRASPAFTQMHGMAQDGGKPPLMVAPVRTQLPSARTAPMEKRHRRAVQGQPSVHGDKVQPRLFFQADVMYSYWFDNTALGLSIAKEHIDELEDIPIVCRAHGFDVFEEERGIYFPSRGYVFSHIERVHKGVEQKRSRLSALPLS